MSARIRNPSPYTSAIGKRNAQILDIVHISNTPVPLDELARVLGVKRPRNLKGNIALLEGRGLIAHVDGGYVTPPDCESRMEQELEDSGCNLAEELQRAKIAREKAAYHYHQRHKANDGYISELEPLDESPYLNPEEVWIHAYYQGRGCYLCDPNHRYREAQKA